MSDIAISIHTDDGKIHDIDAPADITTQECVCELLQGLELARTGVSADEWRLFDKNTGRALDPKLTLGQSGVCSGHALSLRKTSASESVACARCRIENPTGSRFCKSCGSVLGVHELQSDVKIHVVTLDGKSHSTEVALRLKASTLLAEFSDSPKMASEAEDAAPLYLVDQETGTALDPVKSLLENGVREGHHLCVRQAAPVAQMPIRAEKPIRVPSGTPIISPRKQRKFKARDLAGISIGVLVLLGVAGFLTYNHKPPAITVSPGASSLWASQRQEFKAIFSNGSDQQVRWSINPEIGSISSQGLYVAPPVIDAYHALEVTAKSKTHPEMAASAIIMLQQSSDPSYRKPEPAEPVEITLAPHSTSLWALEQQKFKPHIQGTTNTAVTWSLDPPVGTISHNGLYTAPARTMARRSVRIIATSQADITKSAEAVIALKPSIAGR